MENRCTLFEAVRTNKWKIICPKLKPVRTSINGKPVRAENWAGTGKTKDIYKWKITA